MSRYDRITTKSKLFEVHKPVATRELRDEIEERNKAYLDTLEHYFGSTITEGSIISLSISKDLKRTEILWPNHSFLCVYIYDELRSNMYEEVY